MPTQHFSGNLKQKNKRHKGGKHVSKRSIQKISGGRIEKNVVRGSVKGSSMKAEGRAMRQQKNQNLRQQKRLAKLAHQAFAGGYGPPKTVGLVAMSDTADINGVREKLLSTSIKDSSLGKGVYFSESSIKSDCGGFSSVVGRFQKNKKRIQVITCPREQVAMMDMAKVADLIIFVMDVNQDVDLSANDKQFTDEKGDLIITAIKGQGIPSVMGVYQNLQSVPKGKSRKSHKNLAAEIFQFQFGRDVKILDFDICDELLLRAVLSCSLKPIGWRDNRSYMLAHEMELNASEVRISGYLRGRPLDVNQLVHVPGCGSFQLSHIEKSHDPCVAARKGNNIGELNTIIATAASDQESLQILAEPDDMMGEQTWPTREEQIEALKTAVEGHEMKNQPMPTGMDEYFRGHLEDAGAMHDDSDEEDVFDPAVGFGDEEDDEMGSVDEEGGNEDIEEKRRLEADEKEFPDEIELPPHTRAYERLLKYRFLQSVRSSNWDPMLNLPREYAFINRFDSFEHEGRQVMNESASKERAVENMVKQNLSTQSNYGMDEIDTTHALPEGVVACGSYVTLSLKIVNSDSVKNIVSNGRAGQPIVLGAQLKHENLASVVHFNIQKHRIYEEPVRSKEEMMVHCGFRRFVARPIYWSTIGKSDKCKYLRFMPGPVEGCESEPVPFCGASIYAPVTYMPAPVVLTKTVPGEEDRLVATGSLKTVNPDLVILKRIMLTGYPVRVKKRTAKVRYMFFNPIDIKFFKPAEFRTKYGLTGHILEPIGEKGSMKMIFNKPIAQHDTVCLHLYKRVFPPWNQNILGELPNVQNIEDDALAQVASSMFI
eukprot:TRINITY_DN777829_c0_g1_i1.p1 TRINITY_DN777829_c0_g1~~TRINITY_DN777829_c0_g1_i1.p1  ORF type:complete len:865 (-),score=217.34 TRINITY_DN777829_c0_g1_i1:203-2674(-)